MDSLPGFLDCADAAAAAAFSYSAAAVPCVSPFWIFAWIKFCLPR